MSKAPTSEAAHPEGEPDSQVDAMKDQLRKDVASWSAARSGASAREAGEFSVPLAQVARQPSPQPAKRVRRVAASGAKHSRPVSRATRPPSSKPPAARNSDRVGF